MNNLLVLEKLLFLIEKIYDDKKWISKIGCLLVF